MGQPGWVSQRQGDVPPGDDWLGENERRVQAALRVPPRHAAWRLGRWTAKAALATWLDVSPARIEILAASDGAPEAWLDGELAPVSISLSHRGGRALAVVVNAPSVIGCDLELIEPRSGAFVREWLAPAEQRLVSSAEELRRALIANLIWTAKEAATKVRREGLRLNVRHAVVSFDAGAAAGGWRELRIRWETGTSTTAGWWRSEPGWVMSIAAEPAPEVPRALDGACPTDRVTR